jgi:hypothetical protein
MHDKVKRALPQHFEQVKVSRTHVTFSYDTNEQHDDALVSAEQVARGLTYAYGASNRVMSVRTITTVKTIKRLDVFPIE